MFSDFIFCRFCPLQHLKKSGGRRLWRDSERKKGKACRGVLWESNLDWESGADTCCVTLDTHAPVSQKLYDE